MGSKNGRDVHSFPLFPRVARNRFARLIQRGPDSFTNLSVFAFGFSAVWTGIGILMPFKVLELLDSGPVVVFSYALGKNQTLGLIALVGGLLAAMTQPVAGLLSDRGQTRFGKRLPYMAVGGIALAGVTFALGPASTLPAVLVVVVLMQVLGNVGQGPGNALLLDHAPRSKIGAASGTFNLGRVAGGALSAILVLLLMSNYDLESARGWFWSSLLLLSTVLAASTVWSVLTLRPRGRVRAAPQAPLEPSTDVNPQDGAVGYVWFLGALAVAVAAMSALQTYSLFFLQDVIGLENPARGALPLMIVMGGTVALTVVPAGRLSDRFGRGRLILAGALLGAAGTLVLLFARSLPVVVLDGVPLGIAVGVLLSTTWALANDMVPRRYAARNLGLTGAASFIGGGLPRLAGFAIDPLNERSENLGYHVLLIVVAISFLIVPLMLSRIRLPQDSRALSHTHT